MRMGPEQQYEDPFVKLAADLRREAQLLVFTAFRTEAQIDAARAKEDAARRIEDLLTEQRVLKSEPLPR